MNAPNRSFHHSLTELISAVLLAALLVLVPAMVSAQTNEQVVLQRAVEALNANRPGEAIAQLNTILGPGSTNVRAYLLRAQAYEARRQWADALADYQRAQQLEPGNRLAAEGVTRVSGATGQRGDTQLDRLAARVAEEPNNLQHRLLYADALYQANKYAEAAEQYAAYVDRTQPTPDVVQRYLIALANTGANSRGEAIAAEYTRIYPNNADIWMRLGYFQLWMGRYDDAAVSFQTALRYDANLAQAREGLNQATDPSRRTATVYPIDRLTAELRQNPNQDDKRLQLIDLLIENNRFAEAKTHLDAISSRYRDTELWRSRYQLVTQRLAASAPSGPSNFIVDRLTREVRQNPRDLNKRYELVEALIRYQRYWEAYEHLQAVAQEQDRTDRWLSLFIQVDDGLMATRGSSPLYPIDRLTYRLRVNPTDAGMRYNLVRELVAVGRFAEARDLMLQGAQYLNANDPQYVTLMQQIEGGRERFSRERIAVLERQVQQDPNNVAALRELIEHYLVLGMEDQALNLYEPLLQQRSTDDEIRFRYAQTLYFTGRYADALAQANTLLGSDPNNPDFQRLYAVSAIYANNFDPQAEQYLNRLLERNPRDPQLLLDVAVVRMSQGRAAEAQELLARAEQYTQFADAARMEALRTQIAFEQRKLQSLVILEEARALAEQKRYAQAAAKYDEFFRALGETPRGQLKELAQVHISAGDYANALSVFQHLEQQQPEYEVQREIAKAYYNLKSYDQARDYLVRLLGEAENPADYEMLYLLGDTYRELGDRDTAEELYEAALAVSASNEQRAFINDRIAYLNRSGAYDFAALLVPNAELVVGRGTGTGNTNEYVRQMQGVQAQVTLPGRLVLLAGLASHGIQGTPLIGSVGTVSYRANQIIGGAIYDITPTLVTEGLYQESYTNRITVEAGVFDYSGFERTVPYWSARFYHQPVTQLYRFSVGARQTEGAIDLWAAGGALPQFDVRLTQFDAQAETDDLMDGRVKARGSLAYNHVTTRDDENTGLNFYAEAGYRLLPYTHLGLAYNQIAWDHSTSLFFAPIDYSTYELWGEYERTTDNWYGRARAATGIVANSGGFQTYRLEGELIYKLTRHIGLGGVAYISQSRREVQDPTLPSTFDRYNIFVVRGALYITL